MNVLLITYYFPPDQAVGALRPAKVVAALRAAGHQVKVVTAGSPTGDSGGDGIGRIKPLPGPRDLVLALTRVFRNAAVSTRQRGVAGGISPSTRKSTGT